MGEHDDSDRSTFENGDGSREADSSSDLDGLPSDVADEVERLTRLARRAVDDHEAAAYRERRTDILDDYGFTDRIREGDDGDVLVCHPETWIEDGVVRTDRIEDTDRALEVPLDGPGDPEQWDELHDRNLELAERVAEEYGSVHGANAEELAIYASNHFAKPIEALSPVELERFRTEYYPRNVWPTDAQAAALDESLEYTFEVASVPFPDPPDPSG